MGFGPELTGKSLRAEFRYIPKWLDIESLMHVFVHLFYFVSSYLLAYERLRGCVPCLRYPGREIPRVYHYII